ncbi:ExeA family protein [Bowmanella denitrificans]|uniref:ExeA family protein n=1 Tax=Bowmanella denitrificans TaxID=366582 RepID=UPI000C9C7999|nr:AAA family ATPase [Bowmanella denitrificans]
MSTHTPYYLNHCLAKHGLQQRHLAEVLRANEQHPFVMHHTTLNKLLRRQEWPKTVLAHADEFKAVVRNFLTANQVPEEDIARAWEDAPDEKIVRVPASMVRPNQPRATRVAPNDVFNQPELEMLTPKARQHFRIARDPFVNEIHGPDDLFLSPQQLYARESMLNATLSGTIMALVAESGAGKSQVKRAFYHHLSIHHDKVIVVEPYCLDKVKLDSQHILAAMKRMLKINIAKPNQEDNEALIHQALQDQARLGYQFVLVIEEAHRLRDDVLKWLKVIGEWDNGYRKLMAIILIGQSELKDKLSPQQTHIREFTRRCQMITLFPLADSLEPYLRHKFSRVGGDYDRVLTADGLAALRERLFHRQQYGIANGCDVIDMSYPLTVNAFVAAAMNMAAQTGEMVSAELINALKESL